MAAPRPRIDLARAKSILDSAVFCQQPTGAAQMVRPVTRRILTGALLMAAAFTCAPAALAQSSGKVTVAMPSDVPSLDPTIDTSPIGLNVRLNVYDQLTEISADGKIMPRLAV